MNDPAGRAAGQGVCRSPGGRRGATAVGSGAMAPRSEFGSPLAGRLAAAVLLAGGLAAFGPVYAQTPVAGLQPNVDLSATMSPSGQGAAQGMTSSSARTVRLGEPVTTSSASDLFDEPPVQDGGWQGLAHVLQALTPSVNTALPLTPSQITDRINTMLNQGHAAAALKVIQKRIAQEQAQGGLGTDVQLMFLHARALSAVGRHQEAIKLYLHMTVQYPELPEPWNNLATEYLRQGKLEMARDALQMALTADPGYATANANLGQVQLMLARQSFDRAVKQGDSAARIRAQQTQAVIQK